MEIRPNSNGSEYLEAVTWNSALEQLQSLIAKHLGPAVKQAGKKTNFSPKIQGLVDSMGGLQME